MQWNCPHCSVLLTIPLQALGTGWSFSRCTQCAGFALIRRSEINVIKVDKAPPGEKVIIPDLSQKPLLQPPTQSPPQLQPIQPTQPPSFTATPPSNLELARKPQITQKALPEKQNIDGKKPPQKQKKSFKLPRLNMDHKLALTGAFAIISGYLLFAQGRLLWEKMGYHPPASNPTVLEQLPIPTYSNPPLTENQTSPPIGMTSPFLAQEEKKTHTQNHTLFVKSRLPKAHIHAGPGMEFPIVASADLASRYIVRDWNNRWLKISLVSKTSVREMGWIRNDLVQVLSELPRHGITSPDVDPLN